MRTCHIRILSTYIPYLLPNIVKPIFVHNTKAGICRNAFERINKERTTVRMIVGVIRCSNLTPQY